MYYTHNHLRHTATLQQQKKAERHENILNIFWPTFQQTYSDIKEKIQKSTI